MLQRWEVRRSWLARRFGRIDRNRDGVLAAWELNRMGGGGWNRRRYFDESSWDARVSYGFQIGR